MNIVACDPQAGFSPRIHLDPEVQLVDAALRDVLDLWQALAAGRLMPARADIQPRSFLKDLPDLALVDVQRQPLRMRYRLVGTNIANAMMRDLTGRWYDEIYPRHVMAQVLQVYGWIVERRSPLRTTGMALFFDRRMYSYEVLNMPLSSDGQTVDMVLVAMKFFVAEVAGNPGA